MIPVRSLPNVTRPQKKIAAPAANTDEPEELKKTGTGRVEWERERLMEAPAAEKPATEDERGGPFHRGAFAVVLHIWASMQRGSQKFDLDCLARGL